jgi:hypothetical protein
MRNEISQVQGGGMMRNAMGRRALLYMLEVCSAQLMPWRMETGKNRSIVNLQWLHGQRVWSQPVIWLNECLPMVVGFQVMVSLLVIYVMGPRLQRATRECVMI